MCSNHGFENQMWAAVGKLRGICDYEICICRRVGDSGIKKSTGQLRRAAKTLCGMLNGTGGRVLVGVTPEGRIRWENQPAEGCEIADMDSEEILRTLRFLIAAGRLPVAGRIVPGLFEREDEPLFPLEALREALVNAFCHRDYTIAGGAVSLAIYDDRLEIWSDGARSGCGYMFCLEFSCKGFLYS